MKSKPVCVNSCVEELKADAGPSLISAGKFYKLQLLFLLYFKLLCYKIYVQNIS